MSRLYELKENYKQIASMLYEEEIDEQCILDTLESIEGEIEEKADNYAVIIKELLGDAEICKQEKLRLEARQKSCENRAKLLKDKLQEVMIETGKTKFKTAKFSFGIQKNGIQVDDDYIEYKMQDKKKVKDFMILYKQEEIESMNYIFGKPESNNKFTKFELKAISKIDLFDRKVVNVCKYIWENRNDDEKLEEILKMLKEEKMGIPVLLIRKKW